MAVFEYKSLNQEGKSVKGRIEADSLRAAKSQLKLQGLFLQEITSASQSKKTTQPLIQKGVKIKNLALFTRLLASLLKANIPLVEALSAIAKQTPDPFFSNSISDIRDQVNEGIAFHNALKSYPRIFDSAFTSLCEAGEASGTLDQILIRLADLMERRSKLSGKIRMALIYPGILFSFTLLIVVGLFTYVVPQVIEMFEDQENIPWMTAFTMKISDFLINYWASFIIGSVIFFLLFVRWKRTSGGKRVWDRLTLKIPVLGRLLKASDISIFSRTLSTLLYGGVPVLQALDIVKKAVRNEHIKEAVQTARDNIKEGESITAPLNRSGQFPPVVIQMIRIGEKSGELEIMLEQIGESYDNQIDTEVNALTSILEPIMIIIMGCVIAFVVFSVMVPMLEVFDSLET